MDRQKNLIFIAGLFPKEKEDEIISKSKGVIQFAANLFQWSLLEGWIDNGANVKVFNMPFIGSFPKRYADINVSNEIFFYKNRTIFNIKFNNFALYKIYSRYVNMKKFILKNSEDEVLVIYSMNISFVKACIDAKRKKKDIKICLIIPDLPHYMSDSRNIFYRIFKGIEIRLLKKYIREVDYFGVLTEGMLDILKIKNKPNVIIEGIYHNVNYDVGSQKESTITFLYTGTLAKRYGILNLVKAFERIKDKKIQLWICGDGDGKEDISKAIERDQRIKYFGQLGRSSIIEMQAKANVLVNPRPSGEEFTKYSFPSKTMEYLASGTPTIMYRLEGVPAEYYDFIYTPPDNSIEELSNTLLKVASLSKKEREDFGMKAREFIIKNKNSQIQAKKILDLFN